MDAWLKGLIAIACIVVIATGALYASNTYEERQRREAANREATISHCNRQMIRLRDLQAGRGGATAEEAAQIVSDVTACAGQ